MFYLIGVAHRVQKFDDWDTLNPDQLRLVDEIQSCIDRFSPDICAEEHSREALGESNSVAQRVAEAHSLVHRFCDPESDWRQKSGYKGRDQIAMDFMRSWDPPPPDVLTAAGAIEIGLYFPKRERYWLEILKDVLGKSVLFICGQAHIESFAHLLDSRGAETSVIAERIGVDAEDDRLTMLARDYLAAHPEVIAAHNEQLGRAPG